MLSLLKYIIDLIKANKVKIVRYAPPIGLVKNVLKINHPIFSVKDC